MENLKQEALATAVKEYKKEVTTQQKDKMRKDWLKKIKTVFTNNVREAFEKEALAKAKTTAKEAELAFLKAEIEADVRVEVEAKIRQEIKEEYEAKLKAKAQQFASMQFD